MSWNLGLLAEIKNPNNHIISSPFAVVIRDKFPKALNHYLVLPKEDIPTIYDLSLEHLPLLEELNMLAHNLLEVKQESLEMYKIGFHADPSMEQVHLHVISKDFVSDRLKTSKHWRSFNTPLFRPYADVYKELQENGCLKRFDDEVVKELTKNAPLKCNQCEYVGKNMPSLKGHLLQHLE